MNPFLYSSLLDMIWNKLRPVSERLSEMTGGKSVQYFKNGKGDSVGECTKHLWDCAEGVFVTVTRKPRTSLIHKLTGCKWPGLLRTTHVQNKNNNTGHNYIGRKPHVPISVYYIECILLRVELKIHYVLWKYIHETFIKHGLRHKCTRRVKHGVLCVHAPEVLNLREWHVSEI